MDIFAHALWAGAGAQKLNESLEKRGKTKVSILWSAFWGIFPDLFAFSIPSVLTLYALLVGTTTFQKLSERGPHLQPDNQAFDLAHNLYQYSHSLIIFFVVFGVVWFIFKRPRLEMLGWLLHILIDIPSHSINFFPTPFLFPLSNYRFPYGIAWSNQIFMIVNYSLLLLVFLYFSFRKKKFRK